jgi:hypothetical protein
MSEGGEGEFGRGVGTNEEYDENGSWQDELITQEGLWRVEADSR